MRNLFPEPITILPEVDMPFPEKNGGFVISKPPPNYFQILFCNNNNGFTSRNFDQKLLIA